MVSISMKIEPKNPLEESLSKLDLKGLLVLNGIITQQALKLILESEQAMSKLKSPLLIPEQPKLINV